MGNTKQMSTHAHASKLIRADLKKAFPKVKFSVRSRTYSGGDSIDVRWIDGPSAKDVDAIIGVYQEGHFDGMTDSYNYTNRRTDIPQVSYVFSHRADSTAKIKASIFFTEIGGSKKS